MYSKVIEHGYTICSDGTVYSPRGKLLRHYVLSNGYPSVRIKQRTIYVHRLLAEAFIPNPDSKPTVNHKDGVKTNNALSNLEWATYAENQQHAYDTGLCMNVQRGHDHVKSKLSEDAVEEIKRTWPERKYGWAVGMARKYGVNKSTIYDVIHGRSYA